MEYAKFKLNLTKVKAETVLEGGVHRLEDNMEWK
jgi:hypothetical protein